MHSELKPTAYEPATRMFRCARLRVFKPANSPGIKDVRMRQHADRVVEDLTDMVESRLAPTYDEKSR